SLFEGKPAPEAITAKPSSPEPATASKPMEVDRPGTPVPAVEVPELMETTLSGQNSDAKPPESAADSTQLTKKGKKKRTVSWPEESKLREYFFELDGTEQINMNQTKDFGEAAKREMLKDRETFETARRLSHDAMEEKVPWVYPKLIDLPSPLVQLAAMSSSSRPRGRRVSCRRSSSPRRAFQTVPTNLTCPNLSCSTRNAPWTRPPTRKDSTRPPPRGLPMEPGPPSCPQCWPT
ncbi:unnamed protein product, partial [Natator depressus]